MPKTFAHTIAVQSVRIWRALGIAPCENELACVSTLVIDRGEQMPGTDLVGVELLLERAQDLDVDLARSEHPDQLGPPGGESVQQRSEVVGADMGERAFCVD